MKKPTTPLEILPALPAWATRKGYHSLEQTAFLSGAAVMQLDMALAKPMKVLPAILLRQRLALRAAAACVALEGRRDSEFQIRDAFYLTRAGDARGPAGDMVARWRKVGAIRLKRADWVGRLKEVLPLSLSQELSVWIAAAVGQGSPIAQAMCMIDMVKMAFPREEVAALICGDVILARALGWSHPVPLLGVQLKRKDLRDLTLQACHQAVARAAQDALRMGHDLARRAQRLQAVAPSLRAKGSDAAVALFLREDAVLPSAMLAPRIQGTSIPVTDRAARRLCDRLVTLGVVRELTGRSTFRLYGVA